MLKLNMYVLNVYETIEITVRVLGDLTRITVFKVDNWYPCNMNCNMRFYQHISFKAIKQKTMKSRLYSKESRFNSNNKDNNRQQTGSICWEKQTEFV